MPNPILEQNTPSPDKNLKVLKGRVGEGLHAKGSFVPYNRNLRGLSRQNRKNPTPAEAKIWAELLRNKSFSRFKFTRQKPLGSYIADFYCSKLQLIIEIDGESHAYNVGYDAERTRFLSSLGLTVVRYQNHEVINNLTGVAADLQERVTEILQRGTDQ